MKSAFELAMERLGGAPLQSYTAEQKEQLAEVDRKYDARVAQLRLQSRSLEDPQADREARERLAAEIASVEERRQHEKDELRKRFVAE
jgi:cell division protein ZapA (FtsZ GTPase activity inhibitor)